MKKTKGKGSSSATTAGRFAACALPLRRRRKIVKAQRQKRRRAALPRGTAPMQTRDGNRFRTVISPTETGRLGEAAVHQYLIEQLGSKNVIWMNENVEFELPYDIIIKNRGATLYVEVKATLFADKNRFHISRKEWKFASEMGDAYSIAYIALSGRNKARIALLENPHKLCRQKALKLALVMSDEFEEAVGRHLEETVVLLKPGCK